MTSTLPQSLLQPRVTSRVHCSRVRLAQRPRHIDSSVPRIGRHVVCPNESDRPLEMEVAAKLRKEELPCTEWLLKRSEPEAEPEAEPKAKDWCSLTYIENLFVALAQLGWLGPRTNGAIVYRAHTDRCVCGGSGALSRYPDFPRVERFPKM
eukprot:SAG22_NODE_319_length_12493_cov_33.326475_4_plen_151_part_00